MRVHIIAVGNNVCAPLGVFFSLSLSRFLRQVHKNSRVRANGLKDLFARPTYTRRLAVMK